jgi:hypothetical protein
MPSTLSAHAFPEHGPDFIATVTNLGPSSLFLRTPRPLVFREAVTVRFGEVAVHGEVAFSCRSPAGAVVTFRPSDEALRFVEDHMDELEVLVGGVDEALAGLWDDSTAMESDAPGAGAGAVEDPTNTEHPPVDVPDGDDAEPLPTADAMPTLLPSWRAPFARPPDRQATELVPDEILFAAKRAASRRAAPGAPPADTVELAPLSRPVAPSRDDAGTTQELDSPDPAEVVAGPAGDAPAS